MRKELKPYSINRIGFAYPLPNLSLGDFVYLSSDLSIRLIANSKVKCVLNFMVDVQRN